MKLESMRGLLLRELADIRDAEEQLTKALPQMVKAVASPELRQAFESHLHETESQIGRLDRIVALFDEKLPRTSGKAMKGLIDEADELLDAKGDPAVRDAALIAAAQRVEHYEIAAYGCARTFAEAIGLSEAASLLQDSLDEEIAADEKLTELAEGMINVQAAQV